MKLFSIIIPHYNSVNYLQELLDTIPIEDDIQLIVIDDKSDEDTKKIEQLICERGGIFLHNTTEKKGAGVCRNLGLKEAKGKWLLFADADDYYVDGAFDILKSYKDSDSDIVYFVPTSEYRATKCEADRHVIYEKMIRDYQKNPSRENEIALRYKFIVPWSKMIKTELVRKNEVFFDEVPASNDMMFSIKCAYHAKCLEVTSECIYCVTKSNGTLTSKYDEINFWSRVQVYKDRYVFLNQHLKPNEVNGFGISKRCGISVILNALKQGYGWKMAYKVYRYFKINQVKLIDWKSIGTSVYRKIVRKNK